MMSNRKPKHAEPSRGKAGRRARAGVVAVGVLAASVLVGATAAEASTVGSIICKVNPSACTAQPLGVRWQ